MRDSKEISGYYNLKAEAEKRSPEVGKGIYGCQEKYIDMNLQNSESTWRSLCSHLCENNLFCPAQVVQMCMGFSLILFTQQSCDF